MFLAWLITSIALLFSGCSSYLYVPARETFVSPSQINAQYQDVYFDSLAGLRLHGWFFPVEKPKGLIVFFHGNGENLSTHFLSLIWLIPHRYELFIFDYQGYGQSAGVPSTEGTIKDGIAALRWAGAKAKEKNLPLIVYGQSLGGAVAVGSVVETKSELPYKLMVLDSSFLSYQKAAQGVLSRHWLTWAFQWLPYILLSDEFAPKHRVAELSPIPLVVVHGDEDGVVSAELGREIFETAREPKEMWLVKGGRHIDVFWRHGFRYRERFIRKLGEILEEV